MATTAKGIWYPGPNDPNDIAAHLQSVAEFNDANPGIANLTTAERNALAGVELWDGRTIYNLTAGNLETYDQTSGTWSATGQELLDQVLEARDATVDISNIAVTDDVMDVLLRNTGGAGPKTRTAFEERAVLTNVKAYGSVGDGVTNDRPTLITAFNTGNTTSKRVVIPPGVYAVSPALPFQSGMHYIGYGATIRTIGTGAAGGLTGVSGLVLEGMEFDGASAASAALSVDGCSGIKLVKVKAKGGLDYGFYFFNVSDVTLESLYASGNGNSGPVDAGFYLNGTDIRATGLLAKDNAGHGYRLHGNATSQGARITLTGCHATSNDLHGFAGATSGGTQNAPQSVLLSGCQAHDNGTAGVYSGFALHYLNKLTAAGLVASGNAEHGIVLMDLEHAVLSDFLSHSNGKAGLRMQSDFALAQNSRSGVRNFMVNTGVLANNWSANTNDDANYGAVQMDGCRKGVIRDLVITGTRGVAVRMDDPANYTDSSDVDLTFTAYDNTLGNTFSNAQPAGGIYGSYRNSAGVTVIG